jgi:predicted metal-dependent hydrolase
MNLSEIFVITIMAIIIVFYIQGQSVEVEYVVSDIDGRRYLVKNLADKKDAANMLAKLNESLVKLIQEMKREYPKSEDVKRLEKNYNPDSISEGTENNNYTSYSINKGEKIVFCLRSRDGGDKLVPLNVLKYVAIHELSHLMTKEIGHPPILWENFKKLLKVAVKKGIYKKIDYSTTPVKYCGLIIKSSVL